MSIIYRRCAGLDVHRDTVAACVRIRVGKNRYEEHMQTFGTFMDDLKGLREWLKEFRVKQIAMESTGVYWIPVWNMLESVKFRFHLLLVNPAHVRALAGRKTDRIDCRRIAEFLQNGQLVGSFIPPREIREPRELLRRRVHLQQDRNRAINRIGRLLQTVNVKLSSVLSNIVGVSGQSILRGLAKGVTNRQQLVELVHRSVADKKPQLIRALEGRYTAHFRYMLNELLDDLERLDGKLEEIQSRIEPYMQPYEDVVRRLDTIPGVDRLTAWTILTEIGTDMAAFPTAKHLCSWAALCPGNNESAGKRKSGRTRKGDRYLRRALVQSAWGAAKSNNTFLSALFLRFTRKQGKKKAAVSVAHRILTIAYHIIRDGVEYREQGADYFDQLRPERTARYLIRRLERLGFDTSSVKTKAAAEEAAPPASKRRGRPCKCAERSLICKHQKNPLEPPTH